MRVMIMGAGGLGGYLAACLARAGADVAVVGRGWTRLTVMPCPPSLNTLFCRCFSARR